ncbi:MAG: LapA family protein [Ignavibacteria bacterium]|nr:LapA family protein [Ignavibacteria bacterium]
MTGLVIGFILGWLACAFSIARNRDDYTSKIAMLKEEINNLTKGATK